MSSNRRQSTVRSFGSPRGPVPLAANGTVEARDDTAGMLRLARTVMQKSPDDLGALAENDAARYAEWIAQFAAHRARAEAEMQFWSAAIAYLMTSAPQPAANDR